MASASIGLAVVATVETVTTETVPDTSAVTDNPGTTLTIWVVAIPIRIHGQYSYWTDLNSSADVRCVASIAGTVMTVSDVSLGTLLVGATVQGTGVCMPNDIVRAIKNDIVRNLAHIRTNFIKRHANAALGLTHFAGVGFKRSLQCRIELITATAREGDSFEFQSQWSELSRGQKWLRSNHCQHTGAGTNALAALKSCELSLALSKIRTTDRSRGFPARPSP